MLLNEKPSDVREEEATSDVMRICVGVRVLMMNAVVPEIICNCHSVVRDQPYFTISKVRFGTNIHCAVFRAVCHAVYRVHLPNPIVEVVLSDAAVGQHEEKPQRPSGFVRSVTPESMSSGRHRQAGYGEIEERCKNHRTSVMIS